MFAGHAVKIFIKESPTRQKDTVRTFTVISAAVILAVPLFVILSVEVFHVMS